MKKEKKFHCAKEKVNEREQIQILRKRALSKNFQTTKSWKNWQHRFRSKEKNNNKKKEEEQNKQTVKYNC